MLRATLELKERVEIDKYGALSRRKTSDIEQKNQRYLQQINEFVRSAPDKEFLMLKVAFLIGIGEACRTNELTKMTTEDVDVLEDTLILQNPQETDVRDSI